MRFVVGLLFCTALIFQARGQSPQGINYQGVARDAEGKPLVSHDISVRISILKDGATGDTEFAETHSVKTNSFGLFMLVIGQGEATTGSFQFISWAVGNKWLQIELDPAGGNSFQVLGSQQLMSVPYAFYSTYSGNGLTAGQGIKIQNNQINNTGDADNNPANEIITDFRFESDKKLKITEAGVTREVDLSPLTGAGQNLSEVLAMGNNAGGQKITNLDAPNAATDAATKQYVDTHSDADGDASNEIQALSKTENTLSLSRNASTVDLTPYLDNTDNQDLTLAGNTLSLTNDATPINLTPYLDNTDSQNLSSIVSGTYRTINISGGTGVVIDVADNDNSITNEIQDLSLTGNTLSLSNDATTINLAAYLDNTDNQDLTLVGNTLSLTNDATPINLSAYLDNTDSQTLSIQSVDANTRGIAITGGNTTALDVRDADASITNEIQDLSINGNTLSLSSDATTVNLASYLDNTDSQTLSTQSVDANTRSIAISGGNILNVDVRDADASITNEIQDLSLIGNVLSLSSDATTVNLAPYLDNTDNQDLTLIGNTLSLANDATSVSLASYLDNTDSQNLSTTSTGTNRSINISGGTGITIDVADNDNSATNELQNLGNSVSGTQRTITISGGASTTIDVADNDNDAGNELQNLNQVLTRGKDAGALQIQNLGTPTASADATTKSYVDNAISTAIATNYAFKVSYSFINTGSTFSDSPVALTESIDDFNVIGTNKFTAIVSGTYLFTVSGNSLLGGIPVKLKITSGTVTLYDIKRQSAYPTASTINYMDSNVFKLNAGDTVELVITSTMTGERVDGILFGYKL